ncbi:putative bifunctional diguanylate cyclase/phosphodiesterase [Ferrimonas marina]|uniref:Diguanylate cyclase (GGDEF) domain-containing protein n=1 Tax=Ferrimonas marina TaxID=299255 RepID=A0A1M5MDV0_9GAMM|nr:bifunctional diguanylate cyclase/phosphodiesterase [Ferrimonas marina]SHG75391.1 diguanylate cyclase (GGDEF) domain-containing protein [Ferrimonas marina]
MEQGSGALLELLRQRHGFSHFYPLARECCREIQLEYPQWHVAIWLYDPQLQVLLPLCQQGPEPHPLAGCLLSAAPELLADLHNHPFLSRTLTPGAAPLPSLSLDSCQALLHLPLVEQGRCWGVLALESGDVATPPPASALLPIARELGRHLGRHRSVLESEEMALYRAALATTHTAVAALTLGDLTLRQANPAFFELTQLEPQRVLGRSLRQLMRRLQLPKQLPGLVHQAIAEGEASGELAMGPDGQWLGYRLTRVDEQPGYLLVQLEDVSRLHRHQQDLEAKAWRCQLTGLGNRLALQQRLQGDGPWGLMLINVVGFRAINDHYGDSVGDKILIELARRLRHGGQMLETDALYRIGADEFVLLFERRPPASLAEIAALLRKRLQGQMVFGIHKCAVNLSLSSLVLEQVQQQDQLSPLAALEWAMTRAKEGTGYQAFDAPLLAQYQERRRIEQDLELALGKRQFELHYQPLVDVNQGRILGAEALLRWHHPRLGLMLPGRFIELAERSGQIETIGRWVLETALYQLHLWQRRWPALQMHVNVSVKQLLSGELYDICWAQLNRYRVKPGTLVLEITETTLLEDIQLVTKLCDQLGELGIVLAIDDFGTGYSSMRYLKQLPVNKLKIDRSFIADLESSPESQQLVPAIIAMGKALGLSITAEGVENEYQRQFLAALDCDEAQGFLFSKAVLPQTLETLLEAEIDLLPASRSSA